MKRIAIFASGSGTNFEALVEACNSGLIDAKVVLMVCDRKKAYVIERAKKYNVPSFVFSAKDYSSKEEYEELLVEKLEEYKVDLICLAGYMRICGYVLLRKYEGKIINIHPALLPAFKGAHGIEDAYNYGVKVFGVTIHYVDSGMDSGKIIAQRAFEYTEGDSLAEVEEKIHAIEHELYPEVVAKLVKEI
ncbi:MAG: phosphoribosylglycinamide formyltransferase [Anaeroplasma sp.]